jgi:hypothetical protein
LSRASHLLRAGLVAATLLAAALGAYVRFAQENQVFCQAPDEMSEVMPGTRLHGLPLTNFSAPTRYNFFKSMFYSQHGLGDVSFYYLAGGALSALHVPVSEANLYAAGGLTNLVFAAAGGLFAAAIGGAATGWTFALFVLVSPFYVFVSKSGWARLTWTPLLLVLVFLCQWRAMRTRGAAWTALFCALGAFTALTDGFVMLPVVAVVGWYASARRVGALVRDRVFLVGCAAIGLGLAVDLALALAAIAKGTELTVLAYVLARGKTGGLVPSLHVLAAWAQCVDYYFPFRGAWIPVAAAFFLAAREGLRGRPIGIAAAWWLLASFGIVRYAAAAAAMTAGGVPGFLNAYQIAPPSLLLMAWLLSSLLEGGVPLLDRLPRLPRQAGAFVAVAAIAIVMAWQSSVVAFAEPPRNDIGFNRLAKYTDMPLSACRVVKAAAFYVRSHQAAGAPLPYVFQLTNDVYLGHIGEYYYGLSYGGSSSPDDPNHLLDFGWHQFGRQYPPEAFYRPYGVKNFDYYVQFEEEQPMRVPQEFAPDAVRRLEAEGAHIVARIHADGKVIGRILSFRDEKLADIDFDTASAEWNQRFARAGTLMQQPLAGSSYHFGYQWRSPE